MNHLLDEIQGTRRLAKRHDLHLLTASLAFFSLFALFPLLILCFLVSQSLIGMEAKPEALRDLSQVIETLMPAMGPIISQNLIAVMRQNALTNILSVVLLVWSVIQLVSCLHSVFVKLSPTGRRRNFAGTGIVCLAAFLLVCGSCTFFFFLSLVPRQLVLANLSPYLTWITVGKLRYVAMGLALGGMLGSITLLFKILPTQKIRLTNAYRGSWLFLCLFLLGRITYEAYVVFYRHLNQSVYGTFLAFFIVIVWVQYLCFCFLFSAQYTIFLEERDRH